MTATNIDKSLYVDGEVVFIIKGPKKGRNWHYTAADPAYKITQTGSAIIKLQATNTIQQGSDDPNPFSTDLSPVTWSDIATGAGNLSGTIAVEYEFIRVIVSTAGDGILHEAWVRWN